jgi:antitoxin ChpS
MFTARLRKVGGSVMVALPSAFVEAMDTKVGGKVVLELNGSVLTIKSSRPRYAEAELLAKCDPSKDLTPEDLEWSRAASVGLEILE